MKSWFTQESHSILSYGTFCFQIGDFCSPLDSIVKNTNLVAFLCLGAFFQFTSNLGLEFLWCAVCITIPVVALGRQPETELHAGTLFCPEDRLELCIGMRVQCYFSVEKLPHFKSSTGYMNSFFLVIIIKYWIS